MKITCLTNGSGYHSPPSHIIDICGFRLLIDCPLDLSALTAFAPVPTDPSFSSPLIHAEPWYKTPNTLHLWDPSLIDAVLVSTPAGMLSLPFLTRDPRFSAAIYATEAAARIGRLMMEELVLMHAEFVQFYGRGEREGCPDWMKWEELERLSPAVRDVVMGKDGVELGSWMPLYSASDIKECMLKVHSLKYAEEACFNSTLILKAFSSGLEIGSCNWTINGPRRNVAYLSSSMFRSAHAMGFDYRSLQRCDLVLFEGHEGEEHEDPISHDILASRRMWREPCIVISPHYSFRLGPVVHLLPRWHADSRCLLILEQGIDPELALLPFKTPVTENSAIANIAATQACPVPRRSQAAMGDRKNFNPRLGASVEA